MSELAVYAQDGHASSHMIRMGAGSAGMRVFALVVVVVVTNTQPQRERERERNPRECFYLDFLSARTNANPWTLFLVSPSRNFYNIMCCLKPQRWEQPTAAKRNPRAFFLAENGRAEEGTRKQIRMFFIPGLYHVDFCHYWTGRSWVAPCTAPSYPLNTIQPVFGCPSSPGRCPSQKDPLQLLRKSIAMGQERSLMSAVSAAKGACVVYEYSVDWLIDWWVDWSVDWLIDWWVDWSTAWWILFFHFLLIWYFFVADYSEMTSSHSNLFLVVSRTQDSVLKLFIFFHYKIW